MQRGLPAAPHRAAEDVGDERTEAPAVLARMPERTRELEGSSLGGGERLGLKVKLRSKLSLLAREGLQYLCSTYPHFGQFSLSWLLPEVFDLT